MYFKTIGSYKLKSLKFGRWYGGVTSCYIKKKPEQMLGLLNIKN